MTDVARMWGIASGALKKLQWMRGLRAGLAVSVAMVACHLLAIPMGWAALGGFEAILVDNGGPYRSRLATMGTLMLGGALGCVVGALSSTPLALAVGVTAAFCFAATFARVATQAVASTSVIILVIYFAGFGGETHELVPALGNALAFGLGGAWAAALSLVLWPVDPFRPARLTVMECYNVLADFTAGVEHTPPDSVEREAARQRMHAFQRSMRQHIEAARSALETTATRTTSRTVRARSLSVLLETADMLFAETIRWTELMEGAEDEPSQLMLIDALRWLSRSEAAVATGLKYRPDDGGASFAADGSYSLEHVRGRSETITRQERTGAAVALHLAADERDALQNIEIAFEAVRALWSGIEVRTGDVANRWSSLAKPKAAAAKAESWFDAVRANWTVDSVMMRHALRIAVVGGIDALLVRTLPLGHGFWLGMTSIIVLQPYGSGTLRKSTQRVVGTIAGGILAAVLAASIHSQAVIIAVITLTSILTLATYAVDYGWFSFFLTPTFVLMGLPHLRDWHFAGVRIVTTVIGALVAVLAMWLLWPEKDHIHLGRVLARGAAADAAYVRTMLRYWQVSEAERRVAERQVLAPARRNTGLATNDAQETLDRLLLEPGFGRRGNGRGVGLDEALTFVTYLQRLSRAVTTLAVVGSAPPPELARIEAVATRLEVLSSRLLQHEAIPAGPESPRQNTGEPESMQEEQIRRMERQVGVLERAASALGSAW